MSFCEPIAGMDIRPLAHTFFSWDSYYFRVTPEYAEKMANEVVP